MPIEFVPPSGFQDIALLVSRLVAGIVMIYYGWPKIKDLRSNGEDFVKMGFRPGILWGTIIAILEFFGGIFMVFGIYVWLVTILFGFEMLLGMIWKISQKRKFSDYSYDLLLLAAMLILLSFGPGAYTLAG